MIIEAASRIVEKDGLRELTIRGIAKAISYTSGTLYQIFENLDELIVEVHIVTLADLYEELRKVEIGLDPETSILDLAERYSRFARANSNRWNALFEHSLPPGKSLPERYDQSIFRLIGLGAEALQPIFPNDKTKQAEHEARVLWAGLYGIVSLDTSDKLSRFEAPDAFIKSLTRNYVAGLRANLQN